jgi:NADPH:quinone reductase-like Zn-dependent oxidoreductase
MKAVIRTQYGAPDVLHVKDVPIPAPRDNELLIRIRAVSINGSDREGLSGEPLYARIGGLRAPRHHILGSDIAGTVEAAGRNSTEFQPGDDVFGELPDYHSGFAEYVCAPATTLARKSAALTFEQAAAIPQAGVIAYRAMWTKGDVQSGQKVLINGAGGSAGSFAVQLARLRGAEVTAVDSADKLAWLQSLGATHVIDYTREDFTTSGREYDLILDVIAHRSVFASARAVRRGGTYYVVGGDTRVLLQCLFFGPGILAATGKRMRVLVVPQNRADLIAIAHLCEAGKVVPAIDRVYPLAEAREAMRYVAEGRQKGKVVLTV